MLILVHVVLLLCLTCVPALADFSGPVVSVLDGDTISVMHNGRAEKVRLSGIDCPEKGQAYGNNAKYAASELVYGKEITLQTYGRDKYGRTLADVFLPDGTNANAGRSKTAGAGGIQNHFDPTVSPTF